MKTLGERLRLARKKRRISQAELGSALGLTSSRISQVESGGTLNSSQILAAAKFLGVSPAQLLGEDGLTLSNPASTVPLPLGTKTIPILGSVAGGATGVFLTNGDSYGVIEVPINSCPTADAYAVTVAGESMDGHLSAGDIVYVDPHRPPRSGNTVVVQVAPETKGGEWEYFVKTFVRRTETELVLKQLNPPKELTVPSERVAAVHTVAGAIFR